MKHVLLSLVAVLAFAGAVRAQQPGPQMPDPPPEMAPAEVQRLFDAYLIMQAQDALGLSEEQYGQFLTRLRALQETRRKNQQERFQLLNQLQRLTNPRNPGQPDEAAVRERLAALQELESRSAAELRRAYNAVDEVLNVVQQARFRLFEEQVERRKVELLMRARQANRPNRRPPG
ncbi:MAG: hypothetical protein AB7O67_14115 [Vicinamibacterales bacterium]